MAISTGSLQLEKKYISSSPEKLGKISKVLVSSSQEMPLTDSPVWSKRYRNLTIISERLERKNKPRIQKITCINE